MVLFDLARWSAALLLLAPLSCDKFADIPEPDANPDPSAAAAPTDAKAVAEAKSVADAKVGTDEKAGTDTKADPKTIADAKAPTADDAKVPVAAVETPMDPAERFRLGVQEIFGKKSPDEKATWEAYKAGRFLEAMGGFAALAVADPAWKHPFNLACAASRHGNSAMARAALAEAVRRGGAKAVVKARSDADLATVRSESWFEPVLRGEDDASTPLAGAAPLSLDPTPVTPTTPAVAPSDPPARPAGIPEVPMELPGEDASIGEELGKGDLATLRSQLATLHGVPVVMHGSMEIPVGTGREAYAVYSYSRYAKCLATSNKKACRKELAAGDPESEMECTDQWMVRVSLGAKIEIRERGELPIGCDVKRIRPITAFDIDHDGAMEIVIDAVGVHHYEDIRDEITDAVRIVRVLRLDGTVQLELISVWQESFMSAGPDTWLFYLADANADAHADLVMQQLESDGPEDDGPDRSDWLDELVPEVPVKIVHYDPKTDAWPGVPLVKP